MVQVRSCVESAAALARAFVRLALVVANCCAQVGGGTGEPASRRRGACADVPAHHDKGREQRSRVRRAAGHSAPSLVRPSQEPGASRWTAPPRHCQPRRAVGGRARERGARQPASGRLPPSTPSAPPSFRLLHLTCSKNSQQQEQRGRRQAQSALSHIAGAPLSLAVPGKYW